MHFWCFREAVYWLWKDRRASPDPQHWLHSNEPKTHDVIKSFMQQEAAKEELPPEHR